jgi:hypothetical protein
MGAAASTGSKTLGSFAAEPMRRPRGIEWNGYVGYVGAKAPMKAYAAELGAPIQLQVTLQCGTLAPYSNVEKYTFIRHFVAVVDPDRLMDVLSGLPADKNHTYEIIVADKPCKLCMDFDGKEGLPACFASKEDFTSKLQAAFTDIFATDWYCTTQCQTAACCVCHTITHLRQHMMVPGTSTIGW